MKMSQCVTDYARFVFRWPGAVSYCTLGGFMISYGSVITVLMRVSLPQIKSMMLPEDGGWGAVLDGVIIGGLLGGLGPVLAFLGVFVYNRGRQIISRSASEVLHRRSDPPVLYLRSFHDDALTATPSQIDWGSISLPTIATQEEQVVEVLERAGPVVAVGRPGETLPKLGAARLYLQDNESDCLTVARKASTEPKSPEKQ